MRHSTTLAAAVIGASLLAGIIPGPALADELWTGQRQDMQDMLVYESEVGGYAVLQGSDRIVYYVDGLAGNYNNRQGMFTGTWVSMYPAPSDEQSCTSTYNAVDGRRAEIFGSLMIRFDSPSFPTGFQMARWYCEGPTDYEGRPLEDRITFHYYTPVTNVPMEESGADYGFNDPAPGANQQQECLERMTTFARAAGFSDLGRGENRREETWMISGTVTFQSGYQRGFECYHVMGRVDRVLFHDNRVSGSEPIRPDH